MPDHRLELTDRSRADGLRHIHRWAVGCTGCGWHGLHAKTRRLAAREYREHLNSEAGGAPRRRRRHADPARREPTPVHLLPDLLR